MFESRHGVLPVAVFFCLGANPLSAQRTFKESATFSLGANATAVAIERLDSGRHVLWAGLAGGDIASVPLERGVPGTAARTPSGVPGIANIALGDLDGDGKNDVVAVNFNPGNIVVLLNSGGNLKRQAAIQSVTYSLAGGPSAAAIVDWNGDGKNDVLVTVYTLNRIAIFLNQGGGTLGHPTFADCGKGPNWITPVNLDGTGPHGVATANFMDGTVSVFRRGTSAAAQTLTAGAGTAKIANHDVNGDGWEDLIAINQTAGTVSSFLAGAGGGGFGGAVFSPAGSLPKDFAFGPWGGTRGHDLAVTNHTQSGLGGIAVHSGDGTGAFGPGPVLFPDSGPGGFVASGDVDGDGDSDLVHIPGSTGHVLTDESRGCSENLLFFIPSPVPPYESSGYFAPLPDAGTCGPFGIQYEASQDPGFANPFSRHYTTSPVMSLPPPLPPPLPGKEHIIYLRARLKFGDGSTSAWRAWAVRVILKPAAFVVLRFVLNSLTSTVPPGTPIGSVTLKNIGEQPGDVRFELNSDAVSIDPGPLRFEPGEAKEVPIKATDKLVPGVYRIDLRTLLSDGSSLDSRAVFSLAIASVTGADATATNVALFVPNYPSTPLDVNVFGFTPLGQRRANRGWGAVSTEPLWVAPQPLNPAPWISAASPKPDWRVDPSTMSTTYGLETIPSEYGRFQAPLQAHYRCTSEPESNCFFSVTLFPRLPVTSNEGTAKQSLPVPSAVPSGGTSLIVPSAVNATGLGGRTLFVSDGWLTNSWPEDVPVTLIYTPDSENGLTGAGVLRTERVLPPSSTTRLIDLVYGFFQATGSGLVQIRSTVPQVLGLRTVVEAETDGDPKTRFGTEIPTSAFGSGIGKGEGDLVLPGIDDDTASRANIILSETTGAEATATITVLGPDGAIIGSTTKTVPPYSKIQINGIGKSVAPSASISGGSARVSVSSGDGRVFALATVIDNASSSFAAIRGRVPRLLLPSVPVPATLIIPGAARLPGAFNSTFTTSLAIANGTSTEASLNLTYHYVDADDANARKSVTKEVTIPARGALSKEMGLDVLSSFFGITARSFGWIEIKGDVGRVVAMSAVSSLVDPADPSRGRKSAPVEGILADSSGIADKTGQERRFAGAEKSPVKRTNLILVETSGQPLKASVRALDEKGRTLASRAFDVDGRQYFQISDIFGSNGLGLGDGPFQNVEIAVRVLSGDGRLVSFVTRNDNLSGNPEVFVLKEPGPPHESPQD